MNQEVKYKINIFPRDKCLKIAKIICPNIDSEDALLDYIPEECFHKEFTATVNTGSFRILENGYYIPPYFISDFDEIKN